MLRKPNSIPKGDTLIEDPAIEPYFIVRSQVGGYVIYKRVVKGKNDTHYIKTICYPANFNYALKSVSREMLNSKSNHYTSIKSYVKEWKDIEEKMSNLTTIG